MKLDYCLHTHTTRCGHAIGTDEEMVISAIQNGIKNLGFSDHVFLPYITQPGMRGDYSEFNEYVSSISKLKEKYKDQINIYVGFECEYFENQIEYYRSLRHFGIDYLIQGQHYVNENFLYISNIKMKEQIYGYWNLVKKGIESGLFTYLAHPDLYVIALREFDNDAKEIAYKICRLAKEYDIPLEINLNGMNWRATEFLAYPCIDFWKIAAEVGNKVVIGCDAHNPKHFGIEENKKRGFDIIKNLNLNFIDFKDIKFKW